MVDNSPAGVQSTIAGSETINRKRVEIDSLIRTLLGFARAGLADSSYRSHEQMTFSFDATFMQWTVRVIRVWDIEIMAVIILPTSDRARVDSPVYSNHQGASAIPSTLVEAVWHDLPKLQEVMTERIDRVRQGVEWLQRVAYTEEARKTAVDNRPSYS